MTDLFRFSFALAYFVGLAFFVTLIVRFRARRPMVEQRIGPLPPPPAFISWLIPPIILLTGIGDVSASWIPLRAVGVALGLYALVVMPWAAKVLGASYAPGPALLRDQLLVVAGPFRWVRHPIYSAVTGLWLGAALATLNWLLLLLWPLITVGVLKQARAEEQLLRGKFGHRYDEYAAATGRLLPRFARSNVGAA
ncbi:MAG: methyltransferase family protein [Gemmatimonadales bacterium]